MVRLRVAKSSARNVPERILIRIAEITIELGSSGAGMKLQLEGAMNKFRIQQGVPDVRVLAAWDELREDASGLKVFDSGGLWRLFLGEDSHRFEFLSPLFGARPYKVALFNRDFISGKVLLQKSFFDTRVPVYPLQYPLDELLLQNLLAKGRGLEVHACGAVDPRGRGYLFAGQSGAGKTTMARLWRQTGAKILSDDRVILRQSEGKIWMHGTPWHGEEGFASPLRASVEQTFFLRHAPENKRLSKNAAEAAALLFACAFPTFYSPDGLDFTLRFAEEVTKTVPCHELGFVPDERVLQFIQANPN